MPFDLLRVLLLFALLSVSYGQQWAGSFVFSSNRCDESRWIWYATQRIDTNGCLAVGNASTPQRTKINCATLTSQVCDATCSSCNSPPTSGVPSGCTVNGACLVCTDANAGVYSATTKCSSNYLALPFNSSYYVLKVYSNSDCTGDVIAATAANADGTTCIPLSGFGQPGSGKFVCNGDGTGTFKVFSDDFCTSMTQQTPINPTTSNCTRVTGSSASLKASCELNTIFAPRSAATSVFGYSFLVALIPSAVLFAKKHIM